MPNPNNAQRLRWSLLLAAIAVAYVNGRPFSPFFDSVLFWLGKLVGRTWAASPAVFLGTSVVLTVATLLVALVPAFLARLIASRWAGDIGQAAIWLLATIAIAWPALRIAAGLEE